MTLYVVRCAGDSMTCLTNLVRCDRMGAVNKMLFPRGYSENSETTSFVGASAVRIFAVHVHRPWDSPHKSSGFFFDN